jgi:hypothetical protein
VETNEELEQEKKTEKKLSPKVSKTQKNAKTPPKSENFPKTRSRTKTESPKLKDPKLIKNESPTIPDEIDLEYMREIQLKEKRKNSAFSLEVLMSDD